MPGGSPDAPARRAIWSRYVGSAQEDVDLELLVQSSEQFTPADIEFAARKGGHTAFKRAVLENERRPPTTEDYLEAINETRPTLTPDMVTDFQEDIALYSRL